MKKIFLIFGTRPEAIKMCPLVNEFKNRLKFNVITCVTGQHREMLDQVLEAFDIKPEYDLNIMKEGQTLESITIDIMIKIKPLLLKEKPDLVLVHGDTTSAFASALQSFYLNIPVGHVEAGLRTNNLQEPFPEEFNRQAIDMVSDYMFAPTDMSRTNLLNEGKDSKRIFVTGNTGIDALRTTVNDSFEFPFDEWIGNSKLILLTAHRRENQGENMQNIFEAVSKIVQSNEDVKVIYPVHLNPMIQKQAKIYFEDMERVKLISPLDVFSFHNLINRSYLILTDSGGIQEEAPSLGKPVLVLREVTERPEGVRAGTLKVVGTQTDEIVKQCNVLINDGVEYKKMSLASNPYGDGYASRRIVDCIMNVI